MQACDVGEEPSELGFDAVSSDFIESFLEAFPIKIKCSVVPCDKLKGLARRYRKNEWKDDFALVVNLDRSHQPGSHFVGIYKKGKQLFYLDPLKLSYFRYSDIPDFLRCFEHLECWQLEKAVQSDRSWFCGFFVLMFFYALNEETSGLDYTPLTYGALQLNNRRILRNLGRVAAYFGQK